MFFMLSPCLPIFEEACEFNIVAATATNLTFDPKTQAILRLCWRCLLPTHCSLETLSACRKNMIHYLFSGLPSDLWRGWICSSKRCSGFWTRGGMVCSRRADNKNMTGTIFVLTAWKLGCPAVTPCCLLLAAQLLGGPAFPPHQPEHEIYPSGTRTVSRGALHVGEVLPCRMYLAVRVLSESS